jgi:hypothetical protein
VFYSEGQARTARTLQRFNLNVLCDFGRISPEFGPIGPNYILNVGIVWICLDDLEQHYQICAQLLEGQQNILDAKIREVFLRDFC